jgi:hypothetical protein
LQSRSEATNGRQFLLSKPLAAHADINKDYDLQTEELCLIAVVSHPCD